MLSTGTFFEKLVWWLFLPFYQILLKLFGKMTVEINKFIFQKLYQHLTGKWPSKPALKISDQYIKNCRRSSVLSGPFLVKIMLCDKRILVNFLIFFTHKTANYWGINLKSSQNMHFICIYYISRGLNFKNIFKFFTTKLLLKKQTYGTAHVIVR